MTVKKTEHFHEVVHELWEKEVISQTHIRGECVITWDTEEDQNVQAQDNHRSSQL